MTRSRLKIRMGPPSYWEAYGGASTILKSKFVYLAIVITWINYPIWSEPKWWDQVTTILPTILGFTIAAFSIFLSLGNKIFKSAVHKRRAQGRVPLYLKICAMFAHQMFVQAAAVLLAIMLPALYQRPIPHSEFWATVNEWARWGTWAFAYFLFVYGVLLVVAGGMNIFSVATLIQTAEEVEEERDAADKSAKQRWLVRKRSR